MNEGEFDMIFEDHLVDDCADFFGGSVDRRFDVMMSREEANDWRPLWRILITEQDNATEIEQFCYDLQARIFWKHGVLIAYIVERETDATENG
jgi:hypothetical protein